MDDQRIGPRLGKRSERAIISLLQNWEAQERLRCRLRISQGVFGSFTRMYEKAMVVALGTIAERTLAPSFGLSSRRQPSYSSA